MVISMDNITRHDQQNTLRFETAEELQRAVIFYDDIDPYIPAEKLEQITSELTVAGTWGYQKGGNWLEAERRQDGKYYLTIRDALGPHGSEVLLAKKLGASLGYKCCEINRVWDTEGQRFSIPLTDIEAIYAALKQPFDLKEFSEAILAPSLQGEPPWVDRLTSPIVWAKDDKIRITLKLSYVRTFDPTREEQKGRDCEHRIENNCLTGPVRLANSPRPVSIGMDLFISAVNGPTYDLELEQRLRTMGDKAESAWLTPEIAESKRAHAERVAALWLGLT